jgi:hypothetical protein
MAATIPTANLFGIRTEVSRAKRLKPMMLPVQGDTEKLWLGGRDSNPDNGVQSAVSYR